MKVGIIADTHDNLPLIDKAVQTLNKEKVELVLHAGDYIAPFVVSRFKPLQAKMIGVFGNNDAEKELLRSKFQDIGAAVEGRFAEINTEGLKVAMLHGEETNLLESLINTDAYQLVVYGHTHQSRIDKKDRTMVVNPGEVCGYLSELPTIAILDTRTMSVRTVRLSPPV